MALLLIPYGSFLRLLATSTFIHLTISNTVPDTKKVPVTIKFVHFFLSASCSCLITVRLVTNLLKALEFIYSFTVF